MCMSACQDKILVGITGGIGSGKSVVSRICRVKGFAVYDCDSRAKMLMHSSDEIKRELITLVGSEVICSDGTINKALLSNKIFSDSNIRNRVNKIVHESVRKDLLEWVNNQNSACLFVESAILHTSHLDEIVDAIWLVEASTEMCVRRVIDRNKVSRQEVEMRMKSQEKEFEALSQDKISKIFNDNEKSLMEQINLLLLNMSNQKINK